MALVLASLPVAPAIELADAKQHLRVTHDAEDDYIASLVEAATQYVEDQVSVSIMARDYDLSLGGFSDRILLPRGPVTAVDSISYIDADGVEQVLPKSEYLVDLSPDLPMIVRNAYSQWPTTAKVPNAVTVRYSAGDFLAPLRFTPLLQAILLLVAEWFDNRTASSEPPNAVEALLQPFRRVAF